MIKEIPATYLNEAQEKSLQDINEFKSLSETRKINMIYRTITENRLKEGLINYLKSENKRLKQQLNQ